MDTEFDTEIEKSESCVRHVACGMWHAGVRCVRVARHVEDAAVHMSLLMCALLLNVVMHVSCCMPL